MAAAVRVNCSHRAYVAVSSGILASTGPQCPHSPTSSRTLHPTDALAVKATRRLRLGRSQDAIGVARCAPHD